MYQEIPQIITIVSISQDGRLNLKKDVAEYLGMKDSQTLHLDMQDEILLSTEEGAGEKISVMEGNRIHLPEKVLAKLDIANAALVGLVQRKNA